MTSRYRREVDAALAFHRRTRRAQRAVICECGAWWTVRRDGRPLSWLGEWAEDRHAEHARRAA